MVIWKLLRSALLLALCTCFCCSTVLAADAVELTGTQLTLTISGGIDSSALRDGARDSFLTLTGDTELTVRSDTAFDTIYILWDKLPGEWTLTRNDVEQSRDLGFLHEAVRLYTETTEATIKLGASGATVCEIYAFTAGDLPDWVQLWEPILERADLLALPTHADDEHLFFGGILPTYAGERKLRVQVAYLTNHWDDRVRPHELLDGLWTVGVTAYPLISDFPDLYASKDSLAAAESVYGKDKIREYQVELLRRFRPKVVVGHDLNGEYGHGAHILNAVTLIEALGQSGDRTKYPESADYYGIWEVPKAYLHLYPENQITLEWDEPLQNFDGATGFDMAVKGFAKHVSQQNYFAVQRGGTWQDCRIFGLAHSLVGYDTVGNDLFENVDMSPDPTPTPEPTPIPTPDPTHDGNTTDTPDVFDVPVNTPGVSGTGSDAYKAASNRTLGALIALTISLILLIIFQLRRRTR